MNVVEWVGGIVIGAAVAFGLGFWLRASPGTLPLEQRRAAGPAPARSGRPSGRVPACAPRSSRAARRHCTSVSRRSGGAGSALCPASPPNIHCASVKAPSAAASSWWRRRSATSSAWSRRCRAARQNVEQRSAELDALLREQSTRLERIAGMSAEDAKAPSDREHRERSTRRGVRRAGEIRESAQRNSNT